MTLALAVVGAGRMGRRHIAAAGAAAGLELRAVCDSLPGAAARAGPPGVAAATDLAELGGLGADAVVIAAPTPLHVELADRAIAMGLHVLCEKPVGFDPAAATALGERAAAAGRVLAVGFWRRCAWPYVEARRLLDAGAIGEPRLLRLSQWDAAPPPLAFCDPAVSGGIEVDCGVHEFDLVRWLLRSDVTGVRSTGVPGAAGAVGDADAAAALATTAGGHAVTIDLARTCGYDDDVRTELVGSHGALLIEAAGQGRLRLGDASGLREVPGPEGDLLTGALAAQLERFAAACAGATAHATADDAARALTAALAMREARLSPAV